MWTKSGTHIVQQKKTTENRVCWLSIVNKSWCLFGKVNGNNIMNHD